MAGVTAERILWIIVAIVIAALVIFGIVYPYVTSLAVTRDFIATRLEAYSNNVIYITIKNLGTEPIEKIEITLTGTGIASISANGWRNNTNYIEGTLNPGEEVEIRIRTSTDITPGQRIGVTIKATFSGDVTVTHEYTVVTRYRA